MWEEEKIVLMLPIVLTTECSSSSAFYVEDITNMAYRRVILEKNKVLIGTESMNDV